ncbi:MAG: CIA30 family protein [Candidatus Omnitrophica bacterium]|nr:CIA30 family protein [Candidatus Omnitrophota bacterium]
MVKRMFFAVMFVAMAMVVMAGVSGAADVKAAAGNEFLIADFNTGEKPNNIGGDFGAWSKDPTDFTQGCSESFDTVNRRGTTGFAMKLDYSVDSKNPAYNGFWMFLQNFDASSYDNLALWVKGDGKIGYTTVFKVELKNASKQVGRYYVTNITDAWQDIVIPLKDFKGITDFSNLSELVIVFEDRIASNKKGVIYIDDIRFTKNK